MVKMITIKLLKELGACNEGLEYFEQEHGEEASLDTVLSNPPLKPNHAAWLSWNLPAEFLTWEERLALQRNGQHRTWLGRICPAGVEGSTWEARLDLQLDNDIERAWLARICPAGVKGATWEARLALQCGEYDRARLGRICPAGVKGATWEARLALQCGEYDRARLGRICPAGVEGATLEARLALQFDDEDKDYVRGKFGGDL